MKRLPRELNREFRVVAKEPSLTVVQGEQFQVETEDAFDQRITSEDQLPVAAVLGAGFRPNPAAGPVYVEGAQPGDVLVVTIHDIVVEEVGFTMIIPGEGMLGDSATYPECRGPLTRRIEHLPGPSGTTSDGRGVFDERLSWPLRPHVGMIATAPEDPILAGADTNGMSGVYGGNLDCRDVCKGSSIWLQVAHPGALLYLGDVHASQAAELAGPADEVRAVVTLSCRVLPGRTIPSPRVETPDEIIQLSSYRPLDEALRHAHLWLMEWLIEDYGFAAVDAYLQFSVNPLVKMHVYRFIVSGRSEYIVGVSIAKECLH